MLGKYQLIRRIATGGMAEIFLARTSAIHGFEKVVVLKRILPQYAENDEFIRMFLAEARLAATLHHANVVQVYDIGEQDAAFFFTMEYVAGQDLRKLVRAARRANRALPLEHILHVVMGVAAGLSHAHEKLGPDGKSAGIVHRDVSPSNVLVTYDGGVKVVDFGIAKAASSQHHTVAGTLKGKIPYMSPEQCRGEPVDCRSDIFSIGTLLWELTTGTRLFAGDNEFAIINRVASGDVPAPRTIRPDYPPELEAIVMRALKADRNERYSSALDLQIDLEDFAREARLPVSSARVARFMRELFAQEIASGHEMLAADRGQEAPTTVSRLTPTRQFVDGGTVAVPPTELIDMTPSEIRADHGSATPGPTDASYAGGSAVGASYTPASATNLSYRPAAPSNTRGGVIVAVVIAVLFVLGGVGGLVYRSLNDTTKEEGTPDPTPMAKQSAPADEPDATTPRESDSVAAGADADSPMDPPEPAPVDDGGEADGELTLDDEPDEPLADEGPTDPPEASGEEPSPKNDKTDTAAKRPTKRPSKRPTKNPDSGSSRPTTQWDPDSPFPI